MYADDLGSNAGGKFHALFGNAVPILDGNNGDRRSGLVRGHRNGALRAHAHGVIVTAHGAKKKDHQRNEKQGDPGAFREFRDQHDTDGQPGYHGAEAVYESAFAPVRAALLAPMHDHAGLR